MGESYLVIPGRIKDANLRCAIAHRGISRFRVRCGACHRAAPCADPLASPRNDDLGLLRRGVYHRARRRRDRWLLVMTALQIQNTTPRSRGAISPEFCKNWFAAPNNRGRRECRALDAPATSRANEKSTRA